MTFRGEDTRNSFTGFLFEALKKQGIEAFKDDKDIRKGESIAPELIRAIEGSHVFVVVFSKDYASSTWCLRELAHIWNCIQTSRRPLLPIFYDVDPSQVRKQSGDFEKSFAQHQQSFRFQEKEIKTWREVLEQAAKNVEVIFIKEKSDILLRTMRIDALSTMSSLKLLYLGYLNFDFKINFSGTLAKLSNELGYLIWKKYPFECLPPSFEPDKLVQLFLVDSNIKQFWEDIKPLPNLRRLDLSGSKNLIKIPYIGDALYLESLNLEGCIQLEEIGLSVILSRKLTSLYLKDCKSLIKLPQFGEDLILENIDLEGCQKLRHIDPSIGLLKKLYNLNLKNCKNLVSLPNSILGLNSLQYLILTGCSKLYNFQLLYELRDAEQLKKIDIDGAPIHFQSTSSHSREHKKSVSCLMPSSPIFPCMRQLDLSFCNLVEIPDAIGIICCLERLDLSGNNFATLPNLKKLSKLVCLKLQHCKQLKSLPELPSRIDFEIDGSYYALRQTGLYIFNCPELVDRERCTDMAFSWMMQLFQVIYTYSLYFVRSVTPGSEIPRWFNNQHEGNCVSLDASPVMHDHNWIGVAFCAMFVVPHETLSANGFSEAEWPFPLFGDIPVDFYGDLDLELVLDKSDHMCLFFLDRKVCIEESSLKHKYLGRLLLKYDRGRDWKETYAEVKKFGYRWVYKGDIESLGRKRKFGEIEENEYDVFVSFRGEDTRNSFTGFLFQALKKQGIEAFKDDKDIRKGESIAPELIRAIEGSHVFLVVFSKDYASSTWCLRELAHIWNCIQTSPRLLLPIFYDVDPSQVRKQSGDYQKAFAQHQQSSRFQEKEIKTWREVLNHVGNLSGWDIENKQQHAVIEEIVQQIKNILGCKFSTLPYDNLVGMESHFATLSKLICLGPVNDDVRVVGITGMGGIGKSTLGQALYERISHQFNSCCYIDDVSKLYKREGRLGVQKELLSQFLNERNLEICNVSDGTLLAWKRLHNAEALIVLDNVDQDKQLDMFTGGRNDLLRKCLGKGSIIIIISRDQQILKAHGVDVIYQVEPLNKNDAVRLFCKKAFNNNYIMSGFKKLTSDVLSHCQGLPLAIEVLASSLFDKDVFHWRSALVSLKENKSKSIMDVLRISFDQLEDTHKEIFLDIACFFNNDYVEAVKEVLDFRGFNPEYGLQVLVDKSLITMDEVRIEMHDLLCDLGKYIVREKSPRKPWKWSRLWDVKDFHKVMSDNQVAENVEVIILEEESDILRTMRIDALSTMSSLKLFYFRKWIKINFSGTLAKLSNELGYFYWKKYPFECLPPSFEPNKLVELILRKSNIKQLWEDTKPLPNLRCLDLSGSKNLIKMPYIGDALYLESLNLKGCIQLEEIGLSIVLSPKLTSLNLRNCKSLVKLPRFGEDLILEEIDLEGCQKLRHIDPSIGLLKKLKYLNLKNCKNLVSLPNSILGLNSLQYLYLYGCSKLYNTELLYELRDAEQLKKIDIDGAPIHFQSTSSYSRQHQKSVSCLMPSSPIFPCMRILDLSFCNLVEIPDAIGIMSCLASLDLSGNNFATLPNLKKLSKLVCLKLQHCKQLKSLPELPSRIDFPDYESYFEIVQTGLYMFNCPELVDRERCTDMAFSWMIQNLQEITSYIHESVSPGSEIRRWFNNEHEGNCVSLDASPVMHDHNWIGVAFCAIFVVPHETLSAMKWNYPDLGDIPVDFYGDVDLELVLDKSDHMWLFLLDREASIRELHLTDQYLGRLLLECDDKGRVLKESYAEVKKYGYRWVYKEDIEGPSKQLSRKRKFGEIEENEGIM
ncbi:TMV resistance protein N [Glycine soja]